MFEGTWRVLVTVSVRSGYMRMKNVIMAVLNFMPSVGVVVESKGQNEISVLYSGVDLNISS
jgi:hypothetical protein